MLDLAYVRAQFPAFSEPDLQNWAFFENAGGSYTCKPVLDRLFRFYTRTKVQPYASYPASSLAGSAMDESYSELARYLGVSGNEVHFGPSTSQNTYVLANAFRELLHPGDRVIVTNQDHEANSGAWRKLASDNIDVVEWQVDNDTGLLTVDHLEELLTDNTRLVCFPHCSNIVGHVNPVADICLLIANFGAISVVDGVSFAPHGLPDVPSLGADIYLFSTYKTFGPHLGAMVVRDTIMQKLPNQSHFFNDDDAHKRLVPAGPDHAQVAAAAGIAEYFDLVAKNRQPDTEPSAYPAIIRKLLAEHEQALARPLLDFLGSRNDVRLIGPADETLRAPTVSIVHQRQSSAALADKLVKHKVMCSHGDFYARRLVESLGIDPGDGVLRLSFVHYTSPNDIDMLINALDQVFSN